MWSGTSQGPQMNKLLPILLSVAIVFAPIAASAQPSTRFPESTFVTLDGVELRTFTLPNFIELLRIDADLVASEAELELRLRQLAEVREQVRELQIAQENIQHALVLVTEDRERITEQWREQNLRLHECENKPRLGTIIGWTVAAALAVALGGTLIGVRISR